MMAKVRFIHMMQGDGLLTEKLHITEDLETPSEDFLPRNYRVVSDSVQDMNLPSGFPIMDNLFSRDEV